jgi:two-component system LytT family sensor kinase
MNHFLAGKTMWGIPRRELFWWLLFYVLSGITYYFPLKSTSKIVGCIALYDYVLVDVIIRHAIQAMCIIPIWWLFFRKFANNNSLIILLLHCITMPLYVELSSSLQNFVLVEMGIFFKPQKRSLWFFYYVPMAFYLIQFGIFYAYNFWRRSQRQLIKEKELAELAHQSEINALKAQIQPHFLFNTLNSISATVTPEQEPTRILIAKLADTFRYALRSTREDLVLLSDELSFLKTYLELEKERFKKRLIIDIQAEEQVLQVLLPPMLLQPLVENAIIHGIGPSVKGGTVAIRCTKENDKVKISISDTGAGYRHEIADMIDRSKGVGLKNTSLRLEKLYGESIRIQKNNPSGLLFSFEIPITNYAA